MLLAIAPPAAPVTRANLLSAHQLSTGSLNWEKSTGGGKLTFLPFQAIDEQQYWLYHDVVS